MSVADKYFASSSRDLVKFFHDDIYTLQHLVVLLGILLQIMILIFTLTFVVALGMKNEEETRRTTWMGGLHVV